MLEVPLSPWMIAVVQNGGMFTSAHQEWTRQEYPWLFGKEKTMNEKSQRNPFSSSGRAHPLAPHEVAHKINAALDTMREGGIEIVPGSGAAETSATETSATHFFTRDMRVCCGPYVGRVFNPIDPADADNALVKFNDFPAPVAIEREHLVPYYEGQSLPPMPEVGARVNTPQGEGEFDDPSDATPLWFVRLDSGGVRKFRPNQVTLLEGEETDSADNSTENSEADVSEDGVDIGETKPETLTIIGYLGKRARFQPLGSEVEDAPEATGTITAVESSGRSVQINWAANSYYRSLDEITILDEGDEDTRAEAGPESAAESAEFESPLEAFSELLDVEPQDAEGANEGEFDEDTGGADSAELRSGESGGPGMQEVPPDESTDDATDVAANDQVDAEPSPSQHYTIQIKREDEQGAGTAIDTITVDPAFIAKRVETMVKKADRASHGGQLQHLRVFSHDVQRDVGDLIAALQLERADRLKAEEKHQRATERIAQIVREQQSASLDGDLIKDNARLKRELELAQKESAEREAEITKLRNGRIPPITEATRLQQENDTLRAEIERHEAHIRQLHRTASERPALEIAPGDEPRVEVRFVTYKCKEGAEESAAAERIAMLRNQGWEMALEAFIGNDCYKARLERPLDDNGGWERTTIQELYDDFIAPETSREIGQAVGDDALERAMADAIAAEPETQAEAANAT